MSEETATAAPSAEFQAAFEALSQGKHVARTSWEGKKKVTSMENPKPGNVRPPYLLVEVEGKAGVTPMPVTEEQALATDWVVLP